MTAPRFFGIDLATRPSETGIAVHVPGLPPRTVILNHQRSGKSQLAAACSAVGIRVLRP